MPMRESRRGFWEGHSREFGLPDNREIAHPSFVIAIDPLLPKSGAAMDSWSGLPYAFGEMPPRGTSARGAHSRQHGANCCSPRAANSQSPSAAVVPCPDASTPERAHPPHPLFFGRRVTMDPSGCLHSTAPAVPDSSQRSIPCQAFGTRVGPLRPELR
ncbi:unnamed protein product [Mycena citricolor]|uniref:Uncharacterized protein n=1 Tax=Mycena citricolor TaxID=2018698 RepID=A0AAD2K3H6_9AGAR|nr:unnamed protein product [Mycena citricolor]